MTLPYLVGKFIFELWASPWQDNQTIIQPKRITPPGGSRNYCNIFDTTYTLPIKKERFHVYQMGQVGPEAFNLPVLDWKDLGRWVSLVDWVKESKIVFTFYLDDGTVIPMSHIYFMVAEDKNIVFCIREDKSIDWDMDTQTVNFHTYRNTVLAVWGETLGQETMDVKYVKLKRQSDKNALLDFNRQYTNKPGKIFCYVNGFLVDSIVTVPLVENDIVEMLYDSTIVRTVEISIDSMNVYTSKRDLLRKYLFTHPDSYKRNELEYFDDIDFYVLARPKVAPKRFYGVLFHRNDVKNVRQVTNCDYGLNTNVVQNAMLNHARFNELNAKVSVVAYYRKQYKKHPMLYIHNRLHELNKLPFANRVAAMVGVRSNIPEWRADELEDSWFIKGIGLHRAMCDLSVVQDVFGYNAIAYYTGKAMWSIEESTLENGVGSRNMLPVPYTVRTHSSIFEYDSTGKFLLWQRFGDYNQYPIKHAQTHFVEFIPGVGTRQPNDTYNQKETEVDNYFDFRVYVCNKGEEDEVGAWWDATDDPKMVGSWGAPDGRDVTVVGFLGDKDFYSWFVRTDRDFLCREFDIGINRGLIEFPIMQYYREGEDDVYTKPIRVPYGQLDVFLNGRTLVEGIDFFYNFPNIQIVNKHYLVAGNTQRVMVRFMDFCTKDLKSVGHRTIGYMDKKQLSRNNQYNIFDDKNFIYKIAGGMASRDHLGFAENNTDLKLVWKDLEGMPYEIRDVIVPKRKTYLRDTYAFREEAFELDKRVAEYLNQFLPEPPRTQQLPMVSRHKLFSPVLSRLIEDMKTGIFDFDKMETRYINSDVIAYMEAKYKDIFAFDPYMQDEYVHKTRCHIQPSIRLNLFSLTYHQYRFLRTVIEIYYNDEVDTTAFILVEK